MIELNVRNALDALEGLENNVRHAIAAVEKNGIALTTHDADPPLRETVFSLRKNLDTIKSAVLLTGYESGDVILKL